MTNMSTATDLTVKSAWTQANINTYETESASSTSHLYPIDSSTKNKEDIIEELGLDSPDKHTKDDSRKSKVLFLAYEWVRRLHSCIKKVLGSNHNYEIIPKFLYWPKNAVVNCKVASKKF